MARALISLTSSHKTPPYSNPLSAIGRGVNDSSPYLDPRLPRKKDRHNDPYIV
ncbi:hypothetical protein RND71_026557 [Anisodus tanguticus]|uniref:Uncharacterized protein n=1 Tax=Anisodus tanguticus TaxID=243964 RepID=A0AAE1RP46_9SOLA|nr:hypothetical protein RND71_026557 [Anisodus tanguticus]